MYWLTPRLPVRQPAPRNPDQSTHRLTQIDFDRENFDAALHFGAMDWVGVNYLPLANERVIAVCAPVPPRPALPPSRLLGLPLLHLKPPGAWEDWFSHHDLETAGL
ncbi:MAG: hypothetical protein R3D81_17180 [Thalassovita sp.]